MDCFGWMGHYFGWLRVSGGVWGIILGEWSIILGESRWMGKYFWVSGSGWG